MQPKIRFKGFTDPWEQRKFSDFLSESRDFGSTGLTAKRLTVKLWGKGVVPKENPLRGSYSTKYYLRHPGQFIYGKLDFLHAAFGIIPRSLEGFESTLDSPAFNLINGIDPTFLIEYVTRKEFYIRQGEIANGSRRAKRIHVDTFLNMPLVLPISIEQSKIGNIFNVLNNTIAANQNKVDQLKQLKKLLMQKVFSQEWRFKGFTDPWEQRKLGILGSLERGKSKHRPRNDPTLFGGATPFIQTGDVAKASLFLSAYSQTLSAIGVQQSKVWPAGTLVITIAANIADSTIVRFNTAFPDSIIGFQSDNCDLVFIKEQLDYQSGKIRSIADTGTQANLNLKKLSNLNFAIPSINQQKQVGNIFMKLEYLIAANQRKLNQLKLLKKYLMQNMFV